MAPADLAAHVVVRDGTCRAPAADCRHNHLFKTAGLPSWSTCSPSAMSDHYGRSHLL